MSASRSESADVLTKVLGYLNFSSGATDLQFLAGINELFPQASAASPSPWQASEAWSEGRATSAATTKDGNDPPQPSALDQLRRVLERGLQDLRTRDAAFHDSTQAEAVLRLTFDHVLPGYREHHRDLLFHHTDESLWQPLLVARVCESVLCQGSPWDETERIAQGVISQLNDFVGHRPVAVLATRKLEPYPHEWSRPIPLYVRGIAVAPGRYEQLVCRCWKFMQNADEGILQSAHFEFDRLEELSIDARACDFDHPASKRPNYLFGQWDAHQIDQQGYYYRFVVRDITLDALMQRVEDGDGSLADELLAEAAAVLAGTILMASGISGRGPGAHDSTTTLGNLLPRIAVYRDQFYEHTLQQLDSAHRARLEQEASERKQPFGGARQDLNARLARHRALQVQHTQLARIFARMGYPEAAMRQSAIPPVASARMLCQIDCLLLDAERSGKQGALDAAVGRAGLAVDILHRAIECGAMVDPWNILGFDSNYSLFPTPENSVHDERVDALIELMERIFSLYAKLWSEAAARNERVVSERIAAGFRRLTDWWHQFAVHEVQSVEGINAQEMFVAAERAASGLALWYQGGAASGDVRFWAPHAEMFDSPEAFAMVVNALLDRKDHVASMSLLIYWLSEAARVGLEQGDVSFQDSALRWLRQVKSSQMTLEEKWNTIQKFFDYFEVNAPEYWQVPSFDLAIGEIHGPTEESSLDNLDDDLDDDLDDEEEDHGGLYDAAYEEVVYRDSTDDGVEGSIYDEDRTTEVELDEQTRYLSERLGLLECLADLWRVASCDASTDSDAWPPRATTLRRWLDQLLTNRRDLLNLIGNVNRFSLPTPAPAPESLLQYDRHRLLKETILEKSISTALATCDATRFVLAALFTCDRSLAAQVKPDKAAMLDGIDIDAARVMSDVLNGNVDAVRSDWDKFLAALRERSLLYVPLSRHGDPRKILRARFRQRIMADFLQWLPRLGLLGQACALIDTTRQMERSHPSGGAAVTEFDSLFETGFQSIVQAVVKSAATWASDDPESASLVDVLEPLTQSMLLSWLAHSRTLRLSVLERVVDPEEWDQLVKFIERYGCDLFTQSFLGLGNIRAILHQGVGEWLDQLADDDAPQELAIVDDIDRHISHEEATAKLSVILESIVENYGEYRDYNSTTTQSDQGDLLHTLLDFLRLRVEYDRVTWNLKPVFIAHGVLVRNQRNADAEVWRRALVERTQQKADVFLDRLRELQQTYAMQMPTVADRLKGRFVRPMIVGRLCALVKPAIEEATAEGPKTACDLLEQEAVAMAREPAGVGLEMPDWLAALDREVRNIQSGTAHSQTLAGRECEIAYRTFSWEEIQRQLNEWYERQE